MKNQYTVTQINNMIKVALESSLPAYMSVIGEVSNLKRPSSGHIYFSLKDKNSQLPCIMWKSNVSKLGFELENGLSVICSGHIDVYSPYGKYQFISQHISPAGVGSLQIKFEQLCRKLKEEGLFEDSRKKALPKYPFNIAVITSSSGAAVKDISESIHSRFPCAKLYLYPVPVQGKGAEKEIAAGIARVNALRERFSLDLIILGRGGGSLEDLWCFNEEAVARAIAASNLPVISAVGHEIDTTVSDMAADAVASTPTKAGFIAVPDKSELEAKFDELENRLKQDLRKRAALASQQLETIQASAVFKNPRYAINYKSQQLDELTGKLRQALSETLLSRKSELSQLQNQLAGSSLYSLMKTAQSRIEKNQSHLERAFTGRLNSSVNDLDKLESKLTVLNPRSVLQRGFTLTKNAEDNFIVKQPDDLNKGQRLITEFADRKTIESIVD
ncbi:exodeoxyribonuclease VII large subunit [Sedimentisphaera salicampi]|uniref:Exodeoxyribonuclease 7 large subunit n=1 Tax=Sedimentisphaera salicampi TaxID=1941349 RepID=A0A1W6LIT6_9BACT|nr:exodeoxyribonuclease VII large subunit [Sedimentisphaera salicampi]ARN55656.1 Exodeoxyribonuclease 7 large subunit [Sedimentisphaera salicampi]